MMSKSLSLSSSAADKGGNIFRTSETRTRQFHNIFENTFATRKRSSLVGRRNLDIQNVQNVLLLLLSFSAKLPEGSLVDVNGNVDVVVDNSDDAESSNFCRYRL